jgi:hypothetical protein
MTVANSEICGELRPCPKNARIETWTSSGIVKDRLRHEIEGLAPRKPRHRPGERRMTFDVGSRLRRRAQTPGLPSLAFGASSARGCSTERLAAPCARTMPATLLQRHRRPE